ncbi:helix-turn-helix transcriptional regulator [Spirochaeta isovalerica]|uniref:AraC-like DNA-binding protein n=1 Tax=Spirochaeta isovalerica TaxID=150 RepID=A0A841R7J3_9SPIO|nr:AraC family transcriptional regulator [Spirochaeta isovalerica]MBB6479796.1 AraC-like DNA-binding protein [Spirochaeta isovalerica]
MQVISRPAGDELSPIVQEIWHVEFAEGDKVSTRDLIMPTGTLHVVFNFCDDYYIAENGGKGMKLPSILVTGQLDRVWEIRYGKNTNQIGLSLTPAGFLKLFHVPGALYTGSIIDGRQSPWNLSDLYSELKVCRNFEESSSLLETYVEEKSGTGQQLERMNGILEVIESSEGNIAIQTLSDKYGLSLSAFERFFKKTVGMTPKAYANIVRFAVALKQLNEGDRLIDHFYDQSHFIKACKKYTGKTPTELITGTEEITLQHMLKQR